MSSSNNEQLILASASVGSTQRTLQSRQTALSPGPEHRQYNRHRYYNRLMTASNGSLALHMPLHLLDPELYVIGGGKGQSSIVTVFSLWNTMIGSTVVAMPWAVQEAGLVMGMIVIIVIGFIAFYTCNIIVRLGFALKLDDTSDLIYELWGPWGQRITVAMSAILLIGALMAYNVILNSSFYKILDGLSIWISDKPLAECVTCWDSFSTHYTPFILMAMLAVLLNMKEKKSYIRLNSKGVYFVLTTVLFMIVVGLRALGINHWTTQGSSEHVEHNRHCSGDWNCVDTKYDVNISLFESGFLITAGVLTLSFFLHNCVIIILKNNQHPEHNTRDLGFGYLATGTCYFLIGLLGYFGFKGNGFPQSAITQNALDMFQPTNPFAFVIRIILFAQMSTVYPMVSYLVRVQLFGFIYGTDYPGRKHLVIYSLVITSLTTLITIVYPNVGTIVAFFGAICGLYFVYLTPVVMYCYLTGRAINASSTTSNSEENSKRLQVAETESLMYEKPPLPHEPSKLMKALHWLIPLLGLVILIFQFVPPALLQ